MSCDNCCHSSCINGESGIAVDGKCKKCGIHMWLCSNNLNKEQLENRIDDGACGCSDQEIHWYCVDCKNNDEE
jgi:hypothetical protein